MVKFTPYTRGIIIGLLLSDGWLTFSSKANKNARLGFTQSGINGMYFWFVFWSLSHYCSSYPVLRIRSRLGNKNIEWQLLTRAMPCITELYHLFYVNPDKKVIPQNIYELLTPVALAHWILGDGSAIGSGLRLGTDSFTIKECVLLINVLIIKFNLNCSLHLLENKPRIYISAKSKNNLISIVKPHMTSSMYFKLGRIVSNSNLKPGNKLKKSFSTLSSFTKDSSAVLHLDSPTLPPSNCQRGDSSDKIQFSEWLAGLIDGDGQFHTTKKGFSSLKIIMGINDKYPLYEIKHK